MSFPICKEKRNTPPSPGTDGPKKRVITEIEANNMQNNPDDLKQMQDSVENGDTEVSELDRGILIAIEKLLKPIRNDMKDLLVTQRELKDELTLSKQLESKNKKLTSRIEIVEKEKRELLSRVMNLKKKLLESNLIFNGIKEEPWETDSMRQEKVHLAISEMIIG